MSYDGLSLHDSRNGAFRKQEGLLRAKRTEKYGVEGLVLSWLDVIAGPIKAECCFSIQGAIAVLVYSRRSNHFGASEKGLVRIRV